MHTPCGLGLLLSLWAVPFAITMRRQPPLLWLRGPLPPLPILLLMLVVCLHLVRRLRTPCIRGRSKLTARWRLLLTRAGRGRCRSRSRFLDRALLALLHHGGLGGWRAPCVPFLPSRPLLWRRAAHGARICSGPFHAFPTREMVLGVAFTCVDGCGGKMLVSVG